MDRVCEDDGLVAGLTDEAAEVVRAWCVECVRDAATRQPREQAEAYVDALIARVRAVADMVVRIDMGESPAWMSARLSCYVPDSAGALATLHGTQPLEQKLRIVLGALQQPTAA